MDLVILLYLALGLFLLIGMVYEAITERGWPVGTGSQFLKWLAGLAFGVLLSLAV